MKNITTIHRRKTPDSFKLLPKVSRKTRKAIYLEASKYINDLTKLIFGGIILTNILNFNIDKMIIFVSGFIAVIILTAFSFALFLKGKE
ncbi:MULTISPECIES: DUF6722 family protein [Parabacteroides]|jgi:putative ABC transporter, permease/ATP-binding protein|uniref:ABC transporter permease n=1 Tax=Parabacteroides faecis TaxID=1217282 RepID=A0ABR6KHD4_9BACT|nr:MULTISPECIES: DUF6722 family protein [Parabacteroides]MBB4620875.1 hypothetical protein [Parabacteroides faecis]GGJ92142.1 hypothetical protein GCM10007084_14800 [Parabacteroides faecis]